MPKTPEAKPAKSSRARQRDKSSRPSVKKSNAYRKPSQRVSESQQKPRPSLAHSAERPQFEDIDLAVGEKRLTLTRRHFLYGAIGAGAAALMVSGAVLSDGDEGSAAGISVEKRRVMNLDDLKEADRDDSFTMIGDYELPFGTLVWSNSDEIATCLIPTDQASPLATVDVLLLGSGDHFTMLEEAVGASEGFEILDARASMHGIIWVEANMLEEKWRVLCAPMSDVLALGASHVLEEGDATTETPSIAAVDNFAYWQVMPAAYREDAKTAPSSLKRASFIGGSAQVLHKGVGRMACPIYACDDGVVIAARNAEYHSAFDLLHFDGSSGNVTDTMTLPSGMAPNALGYGPNGFAFCFESIYNFGDGISNLGTYTPLREHEPGASYDDIDWFRFGRTPETGPCWCGKQWLMVKSTTAVCGIDLERRVWCSLDVASGCTDWGDYLASSGAGGLVVTAMQIDEVDPSGEKQHKTQVRVWTAS